MLKHIETKIDRYTANLTKGRSSRWHNTGNWPTAEYLLSRPEEKRFATEGDTVECVAIETTIWEYQGIRYSTSQPRTELIIKL